VADKVDAARLGLLQAARAKARERAWAAGAGPDLTEEMWLRFDASLLTAHSDKENAAPTWKKGFGFHPLLCYLDRPDVSGGEALAGLLRPGNAGSNTAADHVEEPRTFRTVSQLRLGRLERKDFAASEEEFHSRVPGASREVGDRDFASDRSGGQRARSQ
jgi:hypothetical protein